MMIRLTLIAIVWMITSAPVFAQVEIIPPRNVLAVPLQTPDGTCAAPAWTYTNDTDTGFARLGADNVGACAGGVLRWDYNTTRLLSTIAVQLPNTGLQVYDTDASHFLSIAPGSNLTAGRTLTVTTGDAARTVTLNGNPTLDDWFDQSVKAAASPTFVTPLITSAEVGHATDTTLSRASAGVLAVEGSNLIRAADLGTGVLTWLGAPSSANFAIAITGETGTGGVVLDTSPTLVTPTLGVATATTINKVALTAPATSATLTVADGKTLTASNTLTFTGTDTSSVAFGAGGTVTYTSNNLSVFAATTSAQLAGVLSDEVSGTGAKALFGDQTVSTDSTPQFARFGVGAAADGTKIGRLVGNSALLQRYAASEAAFDLEFWKGRGTVGTPAAVVDGDRLGSITFSGYYDGSTIDAGAEITARADGAPSGTTVPGRLQFYTRISGGAYGERLRIDGTAIRLGTGAVLLISQTAPTIASGFGTTPTIPSSNGTATFRVNVGTGGTATSGVVTMPTATTGWNCHAFDETTLNVDTRVSAQTTTSITISTTAAWTASDILVVQCKGF